MYVGFCLVGIGLFTSFSLLGSSPGTWSSAARNWAMFSIVSWFPERFFIFRSIYWFCFTLTAQHASAFVIYQ